MSPRVISPSLSSSWPKADCPPPYRSTIEAYREIIPTILRQRKDPNYFVKRELPSGAKSVPYNHDSVIVAAE